MPDLHLITVRPVYLWHRLCLFVPEAGFDAAVATSDFCVDDVGDSQALLRKKKNRPTKFFSAVTVIIH